MNMTHVFFPDKTMAELFCNATLLEQKLGLGEWSIIDSDNFFCPTHLVFSDGTEVVWVLDKWHEFLDLSKTIESTESNND